MKNTIFSKTFWNHLRKVDSKKSCTDGSQSEQLQMYQWVLTVREVTQRNTRPNVPLWSAIGGVQL